MKLLHKARRIVNEANKIDRDKLWDLVHGVRAHALWLHMSVLKVMFRFTAKQLKEYHKELQVVYEGAFDYNNVREKEILDGIKYVVNADPKKTFMGFGYKDYAFQKFDEDGTEYDKIAEKDGDPARAMFKYNCVRRSMLEVSHAEMASMFVLHDVFGFRAKRLERFVNIVRNTFREGKCKAEENIAYLEKLCKCKFSEFDGLRIA